MNNPETLATVGTRYRKKANKQTKTKNNKMNCELMFTYDTPAYMLNVYKKTTKSANRKQESDGSKNVSYDMGYLYEACDQISDFCHQQLLRKM